MKCKTVILEMLALFSAQVYRLLIISLAAMQGCICVLINKGSHLTL